MQASLQPAAARARNPSYMDADATQMGSLDKMKHEQSFLDLSRAQHSSLISVAAPKGAFH